MSRSRSFGWLLVLGAALSFGCGESGPADAGSQDSATLDGDLDGCAIDRFAWGRGGDLMLPGADCLECHVEGGAGADFPFTVAGTVFAAADCPEGAEGATVHIVDSEGTTLDLVSNELGNFYTADPLVPPFHFSVEVGGEVNAMTFETDRGSCNSSGCHTRGSGVGLVTGSRP